MSHWMKRTLPDWMRARLSDNQRFLALCVLSGFLCGLSAVAFHLSIHHLFDWLWEFASEKDPLWFCVVMVAAPTFAAQLVGLAVKYYAPDAAGRGIPQTKAAYYNKGGKVSGRSGILRFVLGTLYVGLGNSLGREGPTVHVSAAISSRIGRWAFNDPARVQSMLPVGMAVVIAAAVSRTILGEDPVLTAKISEDYKTSAWMLVALPLGLTAGLIGHLFVRSTLNLRGWFKGRKGLPTWINPAAGGLSCGLLGLAAFYFTGHLGEEQNSVFSIGYQSLEAAFEDKLTVGIIATLLILKFLAVVINYASGGSGGLFSPTLFLGGMLGGLIGVGLADFQHIFPWIPAFPTDAKVIGGCVLLGMGAMFAAVVRCPFTSLIIIFEMTGNYSLILPLMAGNMIAWQIAKRLQPVSIYNALLLQDGVTLRKLPAYRGAQDYRKLPVQSIMTHEVFTVRLSEKPLEVLKRIDGENRRYHAYPVVDDGGLLAGVVTLKELLENILKESVAEIIGDQEILSVNADTSIRDAANRMIVRDFQQVPVVSQTEPGKLLGWLTLNDIARQQNAAEG